MKRLLSFLFFSGMILILSGCVSPDEFLAASDPARKQVIIGVILPLSGKNKVSGERMLAGLRYGEYELNSRRGIDRKPVKLLIFDTKSTAEGAADAFVAAAENNASGVVAGYATEEVEKIIPLAARYRLPTVIPLATADSTAGVNSFVFRNAYTDK